MNKYIFVTGGVCSSLGKGIAAASIGALLESRNLKIQTVKIDPYINVDAGTMSPYQHGEVYVTDDGAETDLDLGNYARFTRAQLSRVNSITTGQVYEAVIRNEREGRYLGRTVQMIPHITDEIKHRIVRCGEHPDIDVTIIEVGGTVGDIESVPFIEAARQFVYDFGRKNVLFVHLTLVPQVSGGELKTKPTQHSVNTMRELGIQPDVLLCRCPEPLDESLRRKISLFTNVEFDAVISAFDVKTTIYEIPLVFREQNLDSLILDRLGIETAPGDLDAWKKIVAIMKEAPRTARIGVVGKYIHLHDAYKSVYEALHHGGIANEAKIELVKIDSDVVEEKGADLDLMRSLHGLLVPGGFGQRGVRGMIETIRWARENKLPCFGICLGMQVMVIEYARTVLGWEDADSTEFAPDSHWPVVSLLEEQVDVKAMGGTMRLGKSDSTLLPGTRIRGIYGRDVVSERHRHRYEVANKYRPDLEASGLILAALTPDESLVESVQWPDHPWGIGVQYHPEFKSRPFEPHPLFSSFIEAALAYEKR